MPVLTGQRQGAWQDALRAAEQRLRQQAALGRTQGVVTGQDIWNAALQTGARPPTAPAGGGGGRRPARQTVVATGPASRQGQAAAAEANNPLTQLIESFQSASDEANAANEARRDEIARGFADLVDNVIGRLEARERQFQETVQGYGTGQEARINRLYDRLGARAQADLVGRGLTASTILPSVRRGVEEDRNIALADLADRVIGQTLSGQSALSGETAQAAGNLGQNFLGFLERINEVGPDFNQLANLAQAYGAGNQGGGFNVQLPQASISPTPSGGTIGIPAYQNAAMGGLGVSGLGAALVGAGSNPFNQTTAPLILQQLAAAATGGNQRQPAATGGSPLVPYSNYFGPAGGYYRPRGGNQSIPGRPGGGMSQEAIALGQRLAEAGYAPQNRFLQTYHAGSSSGYTPPRRRRGVAVPK